MSSVSSSIGADFDGGGGSKWNRKYDKCNREIVGYFSRNDNRAKVPSKCVTNVTRKHGNPLFCVLLPVLFCVLCCFPAVCHAGKAKKDSGSKNGNFSHSPTNHEEVQARNKESTSSSSASDDYWVGSHKLDFKPHPLLMPSTQTPTSQIPIPIIELGTPPTTSSPSGSNEGGEVDDLSESATTTSEEERKGKTKTRKSRGGRKKSRDQRRMAHRTLWARQNAASNATNNVYMMRPMQQNPYFLHNHHQVQQQNQQSPVLLTAGSMMSSQTPLLIPPLNSRNDDSFHGSAATWSINHPGNGIIAPNLMKSYLPSPSAPQNSGQVTSSSSSQETSQQVQQQQQYPSTGPLHQYQFAYPQYHHSHLQHQQNQLFASQIAAQQQYHQPQQYPLQMPPLAQAPNSFSIPPSGPEYMQHQTGSTPVMISGSNGPVLMYYGSGAVTAQNGMGLIPSASGPIPVKPYNINEVHNPGMYPHLQYNQITGPDLSGAHHHPHYQQNGGGGSSGSSTNPQYFRNNFLRMFMDKMANVGRLLPIPFVTKYASPPPPIQNSQHQEYARHSHLSRRMKK